MVAIVHVKYCAVYGPSHSSNYDIRTSSYNLTTFIPFKWFLNIPSLGVYIPMQQKNSITRKGKTITAGLLIRLRASDLIFE